MLVYSSSIGNKAGALVDRFVRLRWRVLGQAHPHGKNSSALRWQHAVLQAVEVLAVNRRHESTSCEIEDHARRKIVFADTMAKLEVLVKHGSEGERDRLGVVISKVV